MTSTLRIDRSIVVANAGVGRHRFRAASVSSLWSLVFSFAVFAAPAVSDWQGTVHVIDGDSLLAGDRQLRLRGIDAPELRQFCDLGKRMWPCGRKAAVNLTALTKGVRVTCTLHGTDRYGRTLADCYARGQNVAEQQLSRGLAITYRPTNARYREVERIASTGRMGIWSGELEQPAHFRRRRKGTGEPGSTGRD
jgi:endonuclease YncB( thermonuclease family)